ncbi:MAG: hypothetical protein C5B53_07080 [Candidatus Melainabacteria bacterium]|nr:MAG: hypothetical protein C5B53_07080 [Candidatus Melainabacteria bacterium]
MKRSRVRISYAPVFCNENVETAPYRFAASRYKEITTNFDQKGFAAIRQPYLTFLTAFSRAWLQLFYKSCLEFS